MDNKMKKGLVGGALIVGLIFMLSSIFGGTVNPYRQTFTSMDTVINLTVYAKSEAKAKAQADEVKEVFDYYHSIADRFEDHEGVNNVKTINDNAGVKAVEVDQELIDLVNYAIEINETVSELFNITLGEVSDLYVPYFDKAITPPPSLEEVNNALANTGMEYIEVNQEDKTIFVTKTGVKMDLGAIVKGYATEIAAAKLEDNGYVGVLNAGGNVRTFGDKPNGETWNIGLTDPRNAETSTYGFIELAGSNAVVSSGNYERYFTHNGRRYHHIINPTTGYPTDTLFPMVSVITKNSAQADALSTILYTLDYESGLELVESLEGVEAAWFFDGGDIRLSSGANPIICTEDIQDEKCQ